MSSNHKWGIKCLDHFLFHATFFFIELGSYSHWGNTPGGASPRPPYNAKCRELLISMQASFPSQVPLGRLYRLAQATNSVGIPSASSAQGEVVLGSQSAACGGQVSGTKGLLGQNQGLVIWMHAG